MQYDGRETDLPVVEHLVGLSFEYRGTPGAPESELIDLTPSILSDGPWSEDALHRRFDIDLLRVREVLVHLRLESTLPSMRGGATAWFIHPGPSRASERFVPDTQIELHVALRKMMPAPVPTP
jgi:hypothetical protein